MREFRGRVVLVVLMLIFLDSMIIGVRSFSRPTRIPTHLYRQCYERKSFFSLRNAFSKCLNTHSSLFTPGSASYLGNNRRYISRTILSSGSEDEVLSSSIETNDNTHNLCPTVIQLSIPTAEDLEDIGALLAAVATPPDILLLDGDLGAGKTTLARGFVLCKLGLDDDNEEDNDMEKRHKLRVTSPTYLLSNTYLYLDEDSGKEEEIHHMDLYRLSGTSVSDFEPLNLEHVFANCISLIEWPSRLLENHSDLLPTNNSNKSKIMDIQDHCLDITISNVPQSDNRRMTLVTAANSSWTNRLETLLEEGLLDDLLVVEDEDD